MKTTIFKQFLVIIAMILFSTSCTKQENDVTMNNIKSNAINLSHQHDYYVNKMLDFQATTFPQKSDMTINDILDMVENATGIRPILVSDTSLIIDSTNNINLETERIRFVDYATSEKIESYMASLDSIIQNKNDDSDLSEIYQMLDGIENQALSDNDATYEERETVVNAIEVFRGSLNLWDDYLSDDNGGAKGWPKWKKVLFIASADAVGAVIGFIAGSYIQVFGVGIYLPPGYAGAAGGAAAVSLVASIWVNENH